MALFKRTKNDSVLPELDKYYEGERRDRTGLAWLLAFVSIIVIAGIIAAAFLSGRWVYREITADDSPEEQVAVQEENIPSFDGETNTDNPTDNGSQSTDDNSSQEGNSETSEEPEDTSGNETPAQTPTPEQEQPESVPSTGDSGELPSTGSDGIVAVFVTVSTLATGAHYALMRRLQRS